MGVDNSTLTFFPAWYNHLIIRVIKFIRMIFDEVEKDEAPEEGAEDAPEEPAE